MTEFISPVDISNRALQHVGATLIDSTLGFTEDTKNVQQCSFVYGKLRQAELRRNAWRFAIRKTVLRPVDANTMLLAPALWSSATTYNPGAIVSDTANNFWSSTAAENLNNAPGNSSQWEQYFGALTVEPYDTTGTTAYYAGELVYVAPGDGTYSVYRSLVSSNGEVPGTADVYSATTTYFKDQVVSFNSVNYISLVDLNTGNEPDLSPALFALGTTYAINNTVGASDGKIYTSLANGNTGHDPTTDGGVHWSTAGVLNKWSTVVNGQTGSLMWTQVPSAALSRLLVIYPIGTGPSIDNTTKNLFRLPNGYMREAPQDPKAGSTSFLGAPSGIMYTDWELNGDYIVSRTSYPLMLRFVGDVTWVPAMDPMFCEGLACRVAMAVCEPLTQSGAKLQSIAAEYQRFMTEARMVNGIEEGASEPPEDDWIVCRL